MSIRLIRQWPALFVVIATMAWLPDVSAAIVAHSEGQPFGCGDMSTPVGHAESPSPWWDVRPGDRVILDGLLSHGGAGASPTTSSSVTSVNAVAAVFAPVYVPPPQLMVRFLTGLCLIFPQPPPRELLHVPRRDHSAA